MRVPHGTHVLVADGRKRLFARNTGGADAPTLEVVEAGESINPPSREQGTDAPGQVSSPVSGGGSMAESDPHAVEQARFAAETADLLKRHAQTGAFERLIVIAPAKTLGQLRKHYSKDVSDRIIGELGKDVTGHPIGDIEKMLIAHGD